jgi:hypothetical protein
MALKIRKRQDDYAISWSHSDLSQNDSTINSIIALSNFASLQTKPR